MNESITIIIPTCGIQFESGLKRCIESIQTRTNLQKGNVKVLIVANGAKEEIKSLFLTASPQIECIWFEKPLGYVGAINAGLEEVFSKETKPDYVLFLNDDTIIHDRSWIPLLLKPFQTDPNMGLVGAKSLPCPITGIDFPLGFCVLIKREVFEKIGYLDPAWGIGYSDDTDFTIRAKKAGFNNFSYINGYDRKLGRQTGDFPISHQAELSMHSGHFFSLDDWNNQTAKNRKLLAERYWNKVHVIIPTYGRYLKLEKALESINNQIYKNVAIHICSDGDDEKVKKIVDNFNNNTSLWHKAEYSFVEHEGNVGGLPRKSILDSLPSSESEYVVFIDSDNEVNKDFIFHLWQSLFLQEDYGVSWCKVYHQELGKIIPEPEFKDKITFQHIDSLNYMVRLDIAKKHASLWIQEKNVPVNHDFLFIQKCSFDTKVKFVDEVLGRHGQEKPVIYLFTMIKDEDDIIPFFLHHYEPLVSKIFVLDGGSTDKSIELLKESKKVEIISKPNPYLDDLELMEFRNEYWKQYKYDCDWAIICDVDEFLWHPKLSEKLEQFRQVGITLPNIIGYQMVSSTFPDNQRAQLYDVIREGYPDPEHLNKNIIFNPSQITINYEMGCHRANPSGRVISSPEPLKLLHFKYAGYARLIQKSKKNAERISEENKKHHWGFHYARDAQMTREEFRVLEQKSEPVVNPVESGNPLIGRIDLKQQHDSTFYEIIERNQYRVGKADLLGKNVIDIGANNGIFSLLSNEYGSHKIIAVEPNPDAFKLLQANVIGRDITIINKAVMRKSSDKVSIGRQPEYCAHDGRCYIIPNPQGEIFTTTLNELVTEIDNDKPLVLKMDCEGSEYEIIYGADIKTVRRCNTILIEAHEDIAHLTGHRGLIDQLRRYLVSIGFVEKWATNYVDTRVRIFRFDLENKLDDQVTVVISTFLRPEILTHQIEALREQTMDLKGRIIIWQTKSKYWDGKEWSEVKFDIPPDVKLVVTECDLKLPSRFAVALMADTPYVCLMDDDVIPSKQWLEEAFRLSKIENAVVSAYGMKYETNKLNDLNSVRFGDHGNHNPIPIEVDVGGHSWFGRREWFSTFFREPVLGEREGDDIHFAYTLKKYTDVRIFVSPYPEDNKNIWGNTDHLIGLGPRALHARKWEDEGYWRNPNNLFWTAKDGDYMKKNLNDFCQRRETTLTKYQEKGWKPLITTVEKEKKKIEITVDISTKNRYFSTLPLTLLSIATQTYPVKRIIIADDSDPKPDGKMKDLREEPLYQYIFSMIMKKGIQWEVVFGARKGQHYNHQIIMEKADTEWVWRLDDDEYCEPDVLEKLVDKIDSGVGAIGGLVLDPKLFQDAPPGYINTNRLVDIDTRENTQWVRQPKGNTFEVEHLYSTFIFRKTADVGYTLELSPAAHREETIFSYEYVRKGWKLLVTTDAITWHLRNPEGGIRDHKDASLWAHDDQVFKRKLENWKIDLKGRKLITLDLGIGDTICFMEIIPELIKKYPRLVIGTYYPTLFRDYPVEIIHTWAGRDIAGEKIAELDNVYRYLWANSDKGRKIPLTQGFREIFLDDIKV